MKKKIVMIFIFILILCSVASFALIDKEPFWKLLNGILVYEGDVRIDGNLTIDGDVLNVTVIDFNVTNNLDIEGNIDVEGTNNNIPLGYGNITGNKAIINGTDANFGYVNLTRLNVTGLTHMNSNLNILSANISITDGFIRNPNGTNPPTLDTLVTKEFVERAVAGLNLDYFLTDETADIKGYFVLNDTERNGVTTTIETISLSSGLNQPIINFSTSASLPFIFLSEGIYDLHAHFGKTGGAAQTIFLRWELLKRNSTGEFLIITSETSKEVTTTESNFDLHGVFSGDVPIVNTDRLVVRIFADITGGGSSTVTLTMEGTTDSHFTFRTPSSVLPEIFIRRDGSNSLTGPWDSGTQNIYIGGNVGIGTVNPAHKLTVEGDVNISENLDVSGDLSISADGSSVLVPRVGAFTDLSSGEAVRFQFGDEHNAFQNAYANDLQIYSYWGLILMGGKQDFTSGFKAPGFSKTLDYSVLVKGLNDIGDDGGSSGNPIVPLGVMSSPNATGDIMQWMNNESNVSSRIDKNGTFSTIGGINWSGEAYGNLGYGNLTGVPDLVINGSDAHFKNMNITSLNVTTNATIGNRLSFFSSPYTIWYENNQFGEDGLSFNTSESFNFYLGPSGFYNIFGSDGVSLFYMDDTGEGFFNEVDVSGDLDVSGITTLDTVQVATITGSAGTSFEVGWGNLTGIPSSVGKGIQNHTDANLGVINGSLGCGNITGADSDLCTITGGSGGIQNGTDAVLKTLNVTGGVSMATNSGFVGIGTTTAINPLTVDGNANDGVFIVLNDNGIYGYGIDAISAYMQTDTTLDYRLLAGSNLVLYLEADNGFLGVRTSSVTNPLTIEGDANEGVMVITNDFGSVGYGIDTANGAFFQSDATSNFNIWGGTHLAIIADYENGNVGINSTNPAYKFTVEGNINVSSTDNLLPLGWGNLTGVPDLVENGTDVSLGDIASTKLNSTGNLTLHSPDGTSWDCGVSDAGAFSCS